MKYLPRCIGGVCKEKVGIQLIDKCHRNETCVPGRKRCLKSGEVWDIEGKIDELEIGIYSIKRSSAIIWIREI